MVLVSVFKRPKNREDSLKFDDSWTKRIVPAPPISGKKIERTKRTKSFRKIPKKFENKFENKICFLVAYITDPALIEFLLFLHRIPEPESFRLKFA